MGGPDEHMRNRAASANQLDQLQSTRSSMLVTICICIAHSACEPNKLPTGLALYGPPAIPGGRLEESSEGRCVGSAGFAYLFSGLNFSGHWRRDLIDNV
jgi:hypothetical protein